MAFTLVVSVLKKDAPSTKAKIAHFLNVTLFHLPEYLRFM